ncbi:unnamed protein product [Amoebophrya sp. A120]|nr:unnamed protein product [Amoebophrya sp. A120]|eukprot:GSA120T00009121001.1
MAPHQSKPVPPKKPANIVLFAAEWRQILATKKLYHATVQERRKNSKNVDDQAPRPGTATPEQQDHDASEETEESLLSLLFQSAEEIISALFYLAKICVKEVGEAVVQISWWFFDKLLNLLELLCKFRSRGSRFLHGGAGGKQDHKNAGTKDGAQLGEGNKIPLSQTVFLFFIALIAGILYVAALEYSKIVLANEALRAVVDVKWFKTIFNILFSLTAYAYTKGVTTSPGYVSDDPAEFANWKSELHAIKFAHERKKKAYSKKEMDRLNKEYSDYFDVEKNAAAAGADDSTKDILTEQGRTAKIRYCQKERIFKPDRAHHCRVTGKNIMRMDHHCPWMLNTVGLKNQKFFYLFVLYATVSCDYLFTHLLHLMLQTNGGTASGTAGFLFDGFSSSSSTHLGWLASWLLGLRTPFSAPEQVADFSVGTATSLLSNMPTSSYIILAQGALLSGFLSLALNPFLVVHTYFMCKNMTTLEFFEQYYVEDKSKSSARTEENQNATREGGSSEVAEVVEGTKTTPPGIAIHDGKAKQLDDFLLTISDQGDKTKETEEKPTHQSNTAASSAENSEKSSVQKINPYDLGIYDNISQVMGTRNFLFWLLPFVDSYEQVEESKEKTATTSKTRPPPKAGEDRHASRRIGYWFPRNDGKGQLEQELDRLEKKIASRTKPTARPDGGQSRPEDEAASASDDEDDDVVEQSDLSRSSLFLNGSDFLRMTDYRKNPHHTATNPEGERGQSSPRRLNFGNRSHVLKRPIEYGSKDVNKKNHIQHSGNSLPQPPRPFHFYTSPDPDVSVNRFYNRNADAEFEEEMDNSAINMSTAAWHDSGRQNLHDDDVLHAQVHGPPAASRSNKNINQNKRERLLLSSSSEEMQQLNLSKSSSFLSQSKEEKHESVNNFIFTRDAGRDIMQQKKSSRKMKRELHREQQPAAIIAKGAGTGSPGSKKQGVETKPKTSFGIFKAVVSETVDDVFAGAEYAWDSIMAF